MFTKRARKFHRTSNHRIVVNFKIKMSKRAKSERNRKKVVKEEPKVDVTPGKKRSSLLFVQLINFFHLPVIKFELVEIKQEFPFDDDFEFEFKVTDDEYLAILKELHENDDDVIDLEDDLHKCPKEGCMEMFQFKRYLTKHIARHVKKGEYVEVPKVKEEGAESFCHLCGLNIKTSFLAKHIKNHE